jgi:hypothetical protein
MCMINKLTIFLSISMLIISSMQVRSQLAFSADRVQNLDDDFSAKEDVLSSESFNNESLYS